MKYGYARVSTTKQDLTSQIEKLKAENCEKIYTDKLSGRNNNRPEFNKLLNQLQPQDILVVTKLDRLARSTQEGKEIAKQNPNFKDGRPLKYSHQQMQHAMQLLENHSYNQVAKMTGISKSTLLRHRKKNLNSF